MKIRKLFVEHFAVALENFLAGYAARDLPTSDDIARASTLANILLNFPDYAMREVELPPALSRFNTIRAYREQYAWLQEPDYELVCDFANCWKHRQATRQGVKIAGMSSLREGFGLCRYSDTLGNYYRAVKLLLLEHEAGHLVDLRRILVSSSKFWNRELSELGLVDPLPTAAFDYSEHVARDDHAYATPIVVHALNGEPDWSFVAHALEYDYESKKLVTPPCPSDFRATIEFRVAVHRSPLSPLPRPKELKRLEVNISVDLSRPNSDVGLPLR
jgi:hypothetical protein